ncbi:hypothetical protein DFH09DRAFT_1332018 [Mycena vulgaris]|nr:hypothetical protein DFH09DRAFT_1332018 [Mycena vulgaris]
MAKERRTATPSTYLFHLPGLFFMMHGLWDMGLLRMSTLSPHFVTSGSRASQRHVEGFSIDLARYILSTQSSSNENKL